MTIPVPQQRPPTAPPRRKLAIVAWAAAYPTSTVLLAAFKPLERSGLFREHPQRYQTVSA